MSTPATTSVIRGPATEGTSPTPSPEDLDYLEALTRAVLGEVPASEQGSLTVEHGLLVGFSTGGTLTGRDRKVA